MYSSRNYIKSYDFQPVAIVVRNEGNRYTLWFECADGTRHREPGGYMRQPAYALAETFALPIKEEEAQ